MMDREVTAVYLHQCPFIAAKVNGLQVLCQENGWRFRDIQIIKREDIPLSGSAFGVFGLYVGGVLVSWQPLSVDRLEKIIRKHMPSYVGDTLQNSPPNPLPEKQICEDVRRCARRLRGIRGVLYHAAPYKIPSCTIMRLNYPGGKIPALSQVFLSLEGVFGTIPAKIHDFALGISIHEIMGRN